jgi:hypothetical protein
VPQDEVSGTWLRWKRDEKKRRRVRGQVGIGENKKPKMTISMYINRLKI